MTNRTNEIAIVILTMLRMNDEETHKKYIEAIGELYFVREFTKTISLGRQAGHTSAIKLLIANGDITSRDLIVCRTSRDSVDMRRTIVNVVGGGSPEVISSGRLDESIANKSHWIRNIIFDSVPEDVIDKFVNQANPELLRSINGIIKVGAS